MCFSFHFANALNGLISIWPQCHDIWSIFVFRLLLLYLSPVSSLCRLELVLSFFIYLKIKSIYIFFFSMDLIFILLIFAIFNCHRNAIRKFVDILTISKSVHFELDSGIQQTNIQNSKTKIWSAIHFAYLAENIPKEEEEEEKTIRWWFSVNCIIEDCKLNGEKKLFHIFQMTYL